MKRILTLVLALLMVLSVLVACAKPNDDAAETTPADTVASDTDNTETTEETQYVKDGLDGVSFPNTEVTIMYWEDVEQPEFEVEDITGDIVTDAIYNRNMTTESRLGIKLNFIGTPGNYNNQAAFVSKADASIKSGGEYDVFAGYSMTGATLSLKGFAMNVMDNDYIDLDKPWWPDGLVNQGTIRNKLYFLSGDISTNLLHMMYSVAFNKNILENYSLDNPYDLVNEGKWTYSKMFEMTKGLYNDDNGDGIVNVGDSFGFATYSIHYDAFFIGSDLHTVQKDSEDNIVISETFNSERTIKLIDDICQYMWNTNDCFHYTEKADMGTIFSNNNILFALDRSYMVMKHKDSIEFGYGIVPVPKFDESQENYVTTLGFPYTTYVISTATQKPEATAATLECLGSEGYRQVTPMLFETSMKLKYSSDNEASQMYDIIRSTISFDLGRFFCTDLKDLTYNTFRDRCSNNSAGAWASAYKAASKMMEKLLKSINDKFATMD